MVPPLEFLLSPAVLAVLGLGACAQGQQPLPRVAAPPAVPPDPLAAFVATAQPGAEAGVVLADGRPATVRLLRSYHAASGRQCREVLVGADLSGQRQLLCETEAGGWAPVRPLLRGGGIGRP
jgi:hypothetical protein